MHSVVGREERPMRWNRWTRIGFAILAPVLVAVMFAAGEWAQPPASAQSDAKGAERKAAPSEAAMPKARGTPQSARPQHARDPQEALAKARHEPGPIAGQCAPRAKA